MTRLDGFTHCSVGTVAVGLDLDLLEAMSGEFFHKSQFLFEFLLVKLFVADHDY